MGVFFVINMIILHLLITGLRNHLSSIAPHLGEDHVCRLNREIKLELGDGDTSVYAYSCVCVCVCVVAHINAIVYMHINGVYVCVGLTGRHIQRIIFDWSLTPHA